LLGFTLLTRQRQIDETPCLGFASFGSFATGIGSLKAWRR
jgi:hypothetical protein